VIDKFEEIDNQIKLARKAQFEISTYSQERIDELVQLLAWAIFRDDHALHLAKIAVEDTGLGNVSDKVKKNKRKTFGTLCDLMAVKSVGLVENDTARGLLTYCKPIGVVGTLTPSTNPAATPANQALMAIKGGNALIVCPSPAGLRTALTLKGYFDEALQSIGAPIDIFQVIQPPINFDKATYLSKNADMILVTGDQLNVKRGYSSGTPCIGVGKGNVPVIIDDSANLNDAANKVALSKTFDNATSCSSENSLVIHKDVYDDMLKALEHAGGYLATPVETKNIESILFKDGKVNRKAVGKGIEELGGLFGLEAKLSGRSFIISKQSFVGPSAPLSGEKLSLVLSVYKAESFDHAMEISHAILNYEGIGHSVGIHTSNYSNAKCLAETTKVARVLVNQAHTFGNGGGFDNALPFTLTMGCGSWAGNSISDNLSLDNFLNKTVLVNTYAKPQVEKATAFGMLYDKNFDNG
jgi:sulfoacetaldehyde dehydrogenase